MRKFSFIVLILLISARLFAAGTDTLDYPALNKTYLKSYFYDTKSLLVSPLKWHGRQWIELGVVLTAGTIAYTQDEKIQHYFAEHQSTKADNFSKYLFEPLGNGKGTVAVLAGFYLGGRIAKDKRLAGTSLTAAKAFVVSSVGVQIIKQLAHRHRPFQDEIPDHAIWDGPFADFSYTSFPSGHSSAVFSVATVFAMEYKGTIWVPIVAYTLATGTAVSRLYDNKHWVSDIVIGSALGFVTGRLMWKQNRIGDNRFVLLPTFGSNSLSLVFIMRLAEPKHLNRV